MGVASVLPNVTLMSAGRWPRLLWNGPLALNCLHGAPTAQCHISLGQRPEGFRQNAARLALTLFQHCGITV